MWTLLFEASASQGQLKGLAIERGTSHELNAAIKLSVVRRQQAARPYTSKFKTCSTSVFVCTARQEKSRGEKMIALSCLPTIKVRGNVYSRQMLKLACIFPFFRHKSSSAMDDLGLTLLLRFRDNSGQRKREEVRRRRVMPRHTAGRSEQQAALKKTARPHSCFPSAPIVRADRTKPTTILSFSKPLLTALLWRVQNMKYLIERGRETKAGLVWNGILVYSILLYIH